MSEKYAKVGKSEQKTISSVIVALQSLGISENDTSNFINGCLKQQSGFAQSKPSTVNTSDRNDRNNGNNGNDGNDKNFKKYLKKNFVPVYVGLDLSPEDCNALDKILESDLEESYKKYTESKCSVKSPGHVTVAFNNTFSSLKEYETFVKKNYKNGDTVELKVVGYAMDTKCVAFIIQLADGVEFHPPDKNLHVTALLNGEKPVYSNTLLERLKKGDGSHPGKIVQFKTPITLTSRVKLNGKLRKWSGKK
jgi:hypothetical protein